MNLTTKLPLLGVVLTVLVAGLALTATPAHALCASVEEEGTWANYDPNTRSITRAVIEFECEDVRYNGEPPSSFPFYVHLYGSCFPTDCDWGRVGARDDASGWIRTTIDHGYATRYVWIKAYDGGWLRVWIWTNFDDPSRRDYASNDWFRRE